MSAQDSFHHLMARLNAGDDDAACRVFHRFAQRLLALARSRLDDALRRKEDPEDVLQSVFRSFFTRWQEGEFDVSSWDSVWRVLTLLTVRKCADRAEYFHAQCRDLDREAGHGAAGQSGQSWAGPAADPTPSEAAIMTEMLEQLMAGLEARDLDIVTLQLQGYTIPEISTRVHRSERTVSRVQERVRKRLGRLLAAEEAP
jgi:RNA polymerase sigma-70 factor (ECF subfamily)